MLVLYRARAVGQQHSILREMNRRRTVTRVAAVVGNLHKRPPIRAKSGGTSIRSVAVYLSWVRC